MSIGNRRAIVGFPRWTEAATFTASSEDGDYPAAQLGTLPLTHPWRSASTDPADTVITVVLDRARRIDLVVLCRHNLWVEGGGGMTVTLFSDAEATTALTSITAEAWPAVYSVEQVDWDGGNFWDRRHTAEEVAGYSWSLPVLIPGAHHARAVRVEIVDSDNPAGYLQAGLLELAGVHQTPVNPEVGAEYGFESRTLTMEADGGSSVFRERPEGRLFNGAIPYLPRDTAKEVWLEMRRQQRVSRPFYWWLDPTDHRHRLRDSFLARFAALDLQSCATAVGYDAVPIRLKEVL